MTQSLDDERNLLASAMENIDALNGFQPFRRGTVTENDKDSLLDLHSLDNRKKHRATNVGFLLRTGGSGEIHMQAVDPPVWSGQQVQVTFVPWRFEDGAVTVRVKLPPGVKKVNIQNHKEIVDFEAFFGIRKISTTRLKEIHKYVYSIIIRLEALLG